MRKYRIYSPKESNNIFQTRNSNHYLELRSLSLINDEISTSQAEEMKNHRKDCEHVTDGGILKTLNKTAPLNALPCHGPNSTLRKAL